MKTKLIVFVFFFFSIISCSQKKEIDYESGIKKSLTAVFESIKSKNMENAVDYIYPKYLDIITRQQMINILNFSYNNPNFIVDIQNFKVNDIEKPELIKGEYFSITNYSFNLKLKVDWKSITNKDIVKQKMQEAMVIKYGKDNIKYLSKGDYYLINAKMKACAISKDERIWRFLILEEKYKPELVNILPQKVLEKF